MRLLLIVAAVLLGAASAISESPSGVFPFSVIDEALPEHPPHAPDDTVVPSKREARQSDTTGIGGVFGKSKRDEMASFEVAAPPEHPPHDSEDATVGSKREACVWGMNCRGKGGGGGKRETAAEAAAEMPPTNCYMHPENPRCRNFPNVPNCFENPDDIRCICMIYSKREMASEVAAPPEHPPHDSEDARVPTKREACVWGANCRGRGGGGKRETAAAAGPGKREATLPYCHKHPYHPSCRFIKPFPGKRETPAEVATNTYDPMEPCLDSRVYSGTVHHRYCTARNFEAWLISLMPGKRETSSRPNCRMNPRHPRCRFAKRREASVIVGSGKRDAAAAHCEFPYWSGLCRRKREGPGKRDASDAPDVILRARRRPTQH